MIAKTHEGKHFANNVFQGQVLHCLETALADLLETGRKAELLSQDPAMDLFQHCCRQIFALSGGGAQVAVTEKLRKEAISVEKKFFSGEFDRGLVPREIDLSRLPDESEDFGVSKLFGLLSVLRQVDHAALCGLSPHLLELCRMKGVRAKNWTSCYSVGGSFMSQSLNKHVARRINLHKQMLAMGDDVDVMFGHFVDSILEDLDYLQNHEQEFFLLGFLFADVDYVAAKKKGGAKTRGGRLMFFVRIRRTTRTVVPKGCFFLWGGVLSQREACTVAPPISMFPVSWRLATSLRHGNWTKIGDFF